MDLDRRSREYAHWPIDDSPEGAVLEVSFDTTTWHPLAVDAGFASALVAGPDATGNPAGTVVLPVGRSTVTIRATTVPEVPYRHAGVIDVY